LTVPASRIISESAIRKEILPPLHTVWIRLKLDKKQKERKLEGLLLAKKIKIFLTIDILRCRDKCGKSVYLVKINLYKQKHIGGFKLKL